MKVKFPMRYLISVILAGWTAVMAAIFVFGLFGFSWSIKSTVIDGKSSSLNGIPLSWGASLSLDLAFFGVYLGFSAGCVAFGVKGLRSLMRRSGEEVIPVPPLRGSAITVRKMSAFFVCFFLLFLAIGWGMVLSGVASLLGLGLARDDMYVLVLVGGIFAAAGHGMLFQVTSVTFDILLRTWRVRRGIWPLRSDTTGSLDEAGQVTLARETRDSGESGSYEVVVARLEWSVVDRPSLILTEGMISWGLDYGPAVHRCAREIADLLALPLVDETQIKYQIVDGRSDVGRVETQPISGTGEV